ncbi:spiro-SPASM protein [Leptospira bouyouniensis]|uniref:spiro-SPASM protein n=1 Tax=Leptospira bouyouniensis TaxID=2484911 RepID=UPI001090F300|nr:spiro-SPASM protein [Leptospira bouyouniensis]TGM87717.1 spiro-SPASM protein [Leptospira bouyouniensis]
MINRNEYNPSFAVVYLDNQSLTFLESNFDLGAFDSFVKKLHKVFPNLNIHMNVSKLIKTKLEKESLSKFFVFYETIPSEIDFIKEIGSLLPESQFKDPEWDEVCFLYFTGISPILNSTLTEKIWNRHKNFFSQYSYSENIPPGLIPTVITREFLSSIPEQLTSDIHSFFLKNINQYDVDIFFQSPDLRQLRLDFRYNSPRSKILIQGLQKISDDIPYENLHVILKQNPELFRSAPSYLEWEIYKGCELSCIFCPREFTDKTNDGSFVSFDSVKKAIKQFEDQLFSPITISLTGNGEPLLHPEFVSIVKEILGLSQLKELIIETALYKNFDLLHSLISGLDTKYKEKLCIIANITTLKEDTYQSLYGKKGLSQVLESIDSLSKILPQNSLYVQMIKMKEVEEEIDPYFTFFEKKGIHIILQKYNSFAKQLPERRVSDLTPIHRDFCWHLTRDIYLSVTGDVSICKQNQTKIIGNIFTESLLDVWKKGLDSFTKSFNGEHDKIPAPCLNCDEWYTFNA